MEEDHEVPGRPVGDRSGIVAEELNDDDTVSDNDIPVESDPSDDFNMELNKNQVMITDDTGEPMVADIVDLDVSSLINNVIGSLPDNNMVIDDIPELPPVLMNNIPNQIGESLQKFEGRNENIISNQPADNLNEDVLLDRNSPSSDMETEIDTSDDSGDTIVNNDQSDPNPVINEIVPNIIVSHPLQYIEENTEEDSSSSSDRSDELNPLSHGGLCNGIDIQPVHENAMFRRMQIIRSRNIVNQLKTMNLDLCITREIVGLTNEFVNLRHLSIVGAGLTTLEGFPELPNLTKLVLSLNNITGGLHLLRYSPLLRFLDLCVNPLSDFDVLLPLRLLEHLRYLDLHRTLIPNIEDRRMDIYNLIPSLVYLDLLDINMRRVTSFQIQRDCAFEDI